MSVVKRNLKKPTPQEEQLNKQLIAATADSLDYDGLTSLATKVRNEATDMHSVLSMLTPTGAINNLAGMMFGYISQQEVEKVETGDIYGDLYYEGEPLQFGAGFNRVIPYNNSVGITNLQNYQTSTDAMGVLAFGKSMSGAENINVRASYIPTNNIAEGLQNGGTLYMTYPQTWANFSSKSNYELKQILDTYEQRLQQAKKNFKYYLGNTFFTYFLQNGVFCNVVNCTSNANWDDVSKKGSGFMQYTAPTNLIEALQHEIIPTLEAIKQQHFCFNCGYMHQQAVVYQVGGIKNYLKLEYDGVEYTSNNPNQTGNKIIGGADGWTMGTKIPWFEYANPNYAPNFSFSSSLDDYEILCTVDVSASFKTLLASNYLGLEKFDIQFNGNKLSKLCGVDVKVVGTDVRLPEVCVQGTVQGMSTIKGELMPDNALIIRKKTCLQFREYFVEMLRTETLVGSMVELGRLNMTYLPDFNQWENGVTLMFDDGVLTNTQYLTVKTIA